MRQKSTTVVTTNYKPSMLQFFIILLVSLRDHFILVIKMWFVCRQINIKRQKKKKN